MTNCIAFIALDELPQGNVSGIAEGFILLAWYKMRAKSNIQSEIQP